MRWLEPPPHFTAYFSSARRPGRVFRVSFYFAYAFNFISKHEPVGGVAVRRKNVKRK
jgi:hypothetical protein